MRDSDSDAPYYAFFDEWFASQAAPALQIFVMCGKSDFVSQVDLDMVLALTTFHADETVNAHMRVNRENTASERPYANATCARTFLEDLGAKPQEALKKAKKLADLAPAFFNAERKKAWLQRLTEMIAEDESAAVPPQGSDQSAGTERRIGGAAASASTGEEASAATAGGMASGAGSSSASAAAHAGAASSGDSLL